MTDLVKSVAEELLGKDNVIVINKSTMGVEDFAYFLQNVSGSFFKVGVKSKEKGIVQPLHSSLFDIDEDVLPIATAMHTQIALKFLTE
jgi:amidohydrolase